MTISEACAFNAIFEWVTTGRRFNGTIGDDEALDAAKTLARNAYKALRGGVIPEQIDEIWKRRRFRGNGAANITSRELRDELKRRDTCIDCGTRWSSAWRPAGKNRTRCNDCHKKNTSAASVAAAEKKKTSRPRRARTRTAL